MDLNEQRVWEEAEAEVRANAKIPVLKFMKEYARKRSEELCAEQKKACKQEKRNNPGNVIPGNFGHGQAEERSRMKKRLKKLFDKLSQHQQIAVSKLLELPPGRLEEILYKALSEAFDDAAQPPPPTFEDIASSYTTYPEGQRMTVENIRAHLENQFKPYLKAFGAPEDRIYLNDFQKIEPQWKTMYDKLRYEHKKDPKNSLLSELIPKISVRVDKEVAKYSEAETKKAASIRQSQINRNKHKKPEISI